jgi:hypothetical protein
LSCEDALTGVSDFEPCWPTTLGGIRAFADHVVDAHRALAERIKQ